MHDHRRLAVKNQINSKYKRPIEKRLKSDVIRANDTEYVRTVVARKNRIRDQNWTNGRRQT